MSSAKNFGLDACHGKYISFIDSDDYVELNFIEELYKSVIETNSDIALCNYYITIKDKDYCNYYKSFVLSGNEKINFIIGKLSTQSIVCWNKLYDVKIFGNLRFPNGLNNEDTYLAISIFQKANRISYVLEKCLYHYCQREGSITKSINFKSFDKIIAWEKIFRRW